MKDFSKKELKWINQLQKLLEKQPDSLQVFDCESGIAIFKGDLPIDEHGSVDSESKKELIYPKRGHWELGAW